MTTATVTFLIIGGIGVLLLGLSLLGLEMFDFDGFGSLEAVAAMLAAFGFGAAIAATLFDLRQGPALLAAAGLGVAVAVPAGWLTARLVRAADRMRTDATPGRSDLVGLIGTVITPIPAEGYGEIRVVLGGQPVKLYAGADSAIPYGVQVFVISAASETSVIVEQLPVTPGSTAQPSP